MTERFHRESPPYLFATELPFEGMKKLAAPGASCLAVAGSGDIPLWLMGLAAAEVVGVDVSSSSLSLSEIKAAAASALGFEEFLYFFLSGSERAASLLSEEARPGSYDTKRWLALASRIGPGLSSRAKGFLRGLDPELANPFIALLRPTDLAVLDGIPFLSNEKSYQKVSLAARPYPLVLSKMEDYLEETERSFDLIYLSNLVEYAVLDARLKDKEDEASALIEKLYGLSLARLNPGGVVLSYHFHSPGSLDLCCEPARGALASTGLTVEKIGVRFERKSPLAVRFNHHLSLARKKAAGSSACKLYKGPRGNV